MPVELTIKITSPMDERDHKLLSGIAVMVLAVANHELAEQRFPEAFADDETPAEEPTAPCGLEDDAGSTCVSKRGHVGRHKFRPVSPDAATALVN